MLVVREKFDVILHALLHARPDGFKCPEDDEAVELHPLLSSAHQDMSHRACELKREYHLSRLRRGDERVPDCKQTTVNGLLRPV